MFKLIQLYLKLEYEKKNYILCTFSLTPTVKFNKIVRICYIDSLWYT